jgi:predicted aspartyl protease
MSLRAVLIALAFTGPCAGEAVAADCSLKLVNSVPITMAAEGTRVLVSVAINGAQKQFLLDTGGAITQISPAAVKELNLPLRETGIKLLDLYGNASNGAAKIDDFTVGHLHAREQIFPISTFDSKLVAGIFAADFMGEYDIELDFAGGKMNYFSRDHCEGKVVYWPAAAIAAVPMHFTDNHLNLDVTLDGHPLRAMIDTGAPDTTLTVAEARRVFGITAENNDEAFEHVFQKLSFEGLEVGNPHIAIIPDKIGSKDPNNGFVTGSRTKKVDDREVSAPTMLIGMNILSKLHLYIAFREQKIYITPASLPRPTPQ